MFLYKISWTPINLNLPSGVYLTSLDVFFDECNTWGLPQYVVRRYLTQNCATSNESWLLFLQACREQPRYRWPFVSATARAEHYLKIPASRFFTKHSLTQDMAAWCVIPFPLACHTKCFGQCCNAWSLTHTCHQPTAFMPMWSMTATSALLRTVYRLQLWLTNTWVTTASQGRARRLFSLWSGSVLYCRQRFSWN